MSMPWIVGQKTTSRDPCVASDGSGLAPHRIACSSPVCLLASMSHFLPRLPGLLCPRLTPTSTALLDPVARFSWLVGGSWNQGSSLLLSLAGLVSRRCKARGYLPSQLSLRIRMELCRGNPSGKSIMYFELFPGVRPGLVSTCSSPARDNETKPPEPSYGLVTLLYRQPIYLGTCLTLLYSHNIHHTYLTLPR